MSETKAPETRAPGEAQPRTFMDRARAELIGWARALAILLPIFFVFTTAAFGNYTIPTESMVPTLEVGDRIVVSKWAYGYSRHSLPLGLGKMLPASQRRLFQRLPERGDVVVFVHPRTGATMIKRLIGLPGDVIEVRGGRLRINGEAVGLDGGAIEQRMAHRNGVERYREYVETLPNGVRHPIHEFPNGGLLDDFGPERVPDDHFFFMGDNRDNSLDSRYHGMGPVPLENLVGRAETVYFAWPRCRDADGDCRKRWLRGFRD
jgi:signal peptidase I